MDELQSTKMPPAGFTHNKRRVNHLQPATNFIPTKNTQTSGSKKARTTTSNTNSEKDNNYIVPLALTPCIFEELGDLRKSVAQNKMEIKALKNLMLHLKDEINRREKSMNN